MLKQPPILLDILNYLEVITAIIGVFYYVKIKNSYWKYFVFYLVYIAIYEVFGSYFLELIGLKQQNYFSYVAVPIEFVFLFWLYAYKSLQNRNLFTICIIIYVLSFIPDFSLAKGKYLFNSFNYIIGTLLMLYLIFLEFLKQVKSDEILLFSQNKMFYINSGVVLFYVGNLPFFGLYYLIMKEPSIWNAYYIYFIISNCLMYILFSASFIWGKIK